MALIIFAVTAKLVCAFVFGHAICCFSDVVVHFCLKYTLKFQELKPLSERKQNKSASMHVKIYFYF